MHVKPICIFPDPLLRQKSRSVDSINSSIHLLINDMFSAMYEANGIGLAAIQIGIPLRIFVIDLGQKEEKKEPKIFINPEIIESSPISSSYQEGCLSIPNYFSSIERPSEICVKFLDELGQEKELHAKDLLAVCIQHEIDHLNGILFIDYLSKLKRDMITRKFKKIKKNIVSHHDT